MTDLTNEIRNAAAQAVQESAGEFIPLSIRYKVGDAVAKAVLEQTGRIEYGVMGSYAGVPATVWYDSENAALDHLSVHNTLVTRWVTEPVEVDS